MLISLKQQVFQSLDNAINEGYEDILTWSPKDIALDLIACDSELENYKIDDLLSYVNDWLLIHK